MKPLTVRIKTKPQHTGRFARLIDFHMFHRIMNQVDHVIEYSNQILIETDTVATFHQFEALFKHNADAFYNNHRVEWIKRQE